MGDTKKPKKQYARPRKPWDRNRLESETKLKENFGLKNKREIRSAEAIVRKKRQNARMLLALTMEKREKQQKELLQSLEKIGLLRNSAGVDDVLSLSVTEMMERRLQTQVVRKGLANTMKQARQFITHGHIAINGRKVSSPGYIVRKNEEDHIGFYGKPITNANPETKAETKKKFEEALPKGEEAPANPEAEQAPIEAEGAQ
ncbi:MAG: 30S ribosomal protein S4 [Candidatus Diapherotrites archaeon]|uniref:Small ribosomal subunit protein uS4 n=1 Tax=Candidatus Iainarchaeum sp. TaxID=3101447 RepID=A0A8T4LFR0_9ARCH|nr:30S ribosomal protein S4 [Candidatus Diapherotrites archaeon]